MAPSGVALGAVIVLLSVGVMFTPEPLANLVGVLNPFGIEGTHWVTVVAYVILPLLPLCILVSALSLVLRFRRSSASRSSG